jgi:predicted metal-dependent HD superfamily phosphohydrolase
MHGRTDVRIAFSLSRGDAANEEKSAQLALSTLGEHSSLPDERMAAIARYIRATKSHRVPPDESDEALRIVIDIDMSILGASHERYQAYADGVRREYCPAVTSQASFDAGRAAFVSRALEQPSIFHTQEGIARWEEQARRNIAMELESLRAGQGIVSRMMTSVLRWRQRS